MTAAEPYDHLPDGPGVPALGFRPEEGPEVQEANRAKKVTRAGHGLALAGTSSVLGVGRGR